MLAIHGTWSLETIMVTCVRRFWLIASESSAVKDQKISSPMTYSSTVSRQRYEKMTCSICENSAWRTIFFLPKVSAIFRLGDWPASSAFQLFQEFKLLIEMIVNDLQWPHRGETWLRPWFVDAPIEVSISGEKLDSKPPASIVFSWASKNLSQHFNQWQIFVRSDLPFVKPFDEPFVKLEPSYSGTP